MVVVDLEIPDAAVSYGTLSAEESNGKKLPGRREARHQADAYPKMIGL